MPLVPCPKSGCDWSVDPAVVAAGQVLTCPKCGQRFRLSAPAARTGPPAWRKLVKVGVAGLAAVAVGGGVWAVMLRGKREVGPRAAAGVGVVRDADRNFQFTPPDAPWAADPQLRTDLGANVAAFSRPAVEGGTSAASAALAVRDFGTRTPLASGLRDGMTAALGRVFDNLPAEPPLEEATWAGKPAAVWRFRGQHKATGEVVAGEVYSLTHRGVGYTFFGWAAERDFTPADLDRVRAGFQLLDGRANWQPTAASEQVYRGPAGGYRLTAYEKVWATTRADGADLELQAVLKGRGSRDFPPKAAARVWKLADPGDAAAVGEARVRKENTRDPELFGPTEFVERTEPPAGDAPPGPETPATPVRRFRVTTGTAESGRVRRLVAFAAIRVGADVVVAEAACPWDEREVWERRLVQLVGSLRE